MTYKDTEHPEKQVVFHNRTKSDVLLDTFRAPNERGDKNLLNKEVFSLGYIYCLSIFNTNGILPDLFRGTMWFKKIVKIFKITLAFRFRNKAVMTNKSTETILTYPMTKMTKWKVEISK